VEELQGGSWSAIHDLTVHDDVYNWPQFPSIEVGNDGVVHAFWYQEFHDDCQTFSGEAVFYKSREDGTWVDRSFTLNGHVGRHTQLRLDRFAQANFVWSEKVADLEDVFFAGYVPTAAVDDLDAASTLRFVARPNPFEIATTLVIESGEAVGIELTVFDAGGRLVRRLAEGMSGPGPWRIRWDGRDDEGRDLPAGAYRARILAGGRSATCGLVRLR